MKRSFIWFYFAVVVFAGVQKARAYNFTRDFQNGFYWGGFPIGMAKFATNSSDGQLLASLVSQAEAAWENSVGRNLWDFSSGFSTGSPSGNHIRWSENFADETGYDQNGTLAITVRKSSGTHYVHSEIILNASFPGMKTNQNQILYRTILHEMGHVIGLDHSSSHWVVMAPSLSSATSLQNDDVLGMNSIVDETLYRQATGFVSPLSQSEESNGSKILACGTVTLGNGDGPSNGTKSFIFSILIGLMIIKFFSRRSF